MQKHQNLNKNLPNNVFISFTLFLLVAGLGLIWYIYNQLNPGSNLNFSPINFVRTETPEIPTSPVTSEPVSLSMNLTHPDDNILVFEPDLLVSGKTAAKAYVIVSLAENDHSVDVDKDGNFSATLKLKEGVNNLSVTSFDNNGNIKYENRTVYYSKEKL